MTEPCDLTAVDRPGLQQLATAFVGHERTTDDALRSAVAVMCASHPQQPEQPPAPSQILAGVIVPAGGDAWVQPVGAHDAYQVGDRVTYEGQVWESTVKDNVWAPGFYGWKVA